MRRVEQDWQWSLFDPKKVPHLHRPVRRGLRRRLPAGGDRRPVRAPDPGPRAVRPDDATLAETGNGWMTFKDASNPKCNQTGSHASDGTPNVVHLSNLCTEILEVTNQSETAVCNLGSHQPRCHGAARRLRRTAVRLRPAGRGGPPGGALPGPGDRHQLLPDRRGRELQRPVAPGRPRAHGPAGRVLQAAPAVRLGRGPGPVHPHLRGDLLQRARRLRRPGRAVRPAPGLRRDPRRQGRAPVRPVGRHPVGPGPLGRRCGAHRPGAACATRC